jgi:uncharacterized repeat protein (TIGR01451 family)
MQQSLGWLSWLGRSTITPSMAATIDGATVTYTATVVNDGWIDLPLAYFTATFPSELTLGNYHSDLSSVGADLVWNGPLNRGQSKVLTYTATISGSLPLGSVVRQESRISYPDHNILFDRMTDVYVNFPNLNGSTMSVDPPQNVEENDILTYTIVLRNNGSVDAPVVTTTNTLPHMLDLVSVDAPSRGNVHTFGNSLTWTTPISHNQIVTLTYRAVVSYQTQSNINNTALVSDTFNPPLLLTAQTTFKSVSVYLPVIMKN